MPRPLDTEMSWTQRRLRRAVGGWSSTAGPQPGLLFGYMPGQALGPGASFTRTTTAYQTNASGVLNQVASGTIRDGNYISGVRTTLLEGARTNDCRQSNDLTQAVWTQASASSLLNMTGPDGIANSASTLTEDGTNAIHRVSHSTTGLAFTANTTQAISVYVKANGETTGTFYLDGNVNGGFGVMFDLSAVTTTNYTQGVGPSTVTSKRIVALGNGWFRIEVTGKPDPTSTSGNMTVSLRDNLAFLGNGTSGLQVWGVQHEADATFCSSVIPTAAVSVTRNADTLSFPYTTPPGAMTVYIDFYEMGTNLQGTALGMYSICNAAGSTAKLDTITSGGVYAIENVQTAGTRNSSPVAGTALGNEVEFRTAIAANGVTTAGQSINRGAEGLGTPSAAIVMDAAWSGPLFWLNSVGSAQMGFGAYASAKILSGVQPLSTCRTA